MRRNPQLGRMIYAQYFSHMEEGIAMKNKQAELIKQLSDKEIVLNLYLTQCIILFITFVLSRIIHGGWFFVFEFLWWDWGHFYLGVGVALVIVLAELIAMKFLPEHYFDD